RRRPPPSDLLRREPAQQPRQFGSGRYSRQQARQGAVFELAKDEVRRIRLSASQAIQDVYQRHPERIQIIGGRTISPTELRRRHSVERLVERRLIGPCRGRDALAKNDFALCRVSPEEVVRPDRPMRDTASLQRREHARERLQHSARKLGGRETGCGAGAEARALRSRKEEG